MAAEKSDGIRTVRTKAAQPRERPAEPPELHIRRCVRNGAGRGPQVFRPQRGPDGFVVWRSEEHTSELQSLMRISYAVFCLKKKIVFYVAKDATTTSVMHIGVHGSGAG